MNLTRVKPDDKLKHPGAKTFSEFVQDLNDFHQYLFLRPIYLLVSHQSVFISPGALKLLSVLSEPGVSAGDGHNVTIIAHNINTRPHPKATRCT